MIFARRSRSASAWREMAGYLLGQVYGFHFHLGHLMPQGRCPHQDGLQTQVDFLRWLSRSSTLASPEDTAEVVCAS